MDTTEGSNPTEKDAVADIKPEESDNPLIQSVLQDLVDLDKDYMELELDNENYKKKLDEVKVLQKKCLSGIAHQRYRIKKINEALKAIPNPSTEDKKHMTEAQNRMTKRKNTFRDFEDHLPHKNGIYLNIILGQVNISLLNKEDKYLYKQDYERFKLTLSYIQLGLSMILVFANYIVNFTSLRWADSVLHFLLVWYYCTLTIREQILIVNGSRIKGWWLLHHFVSTACSAITLIWPDGYSYQSFRTQYGWFILYIAFVQVLQYYYQRGCLYRLKCLGQRHDMDITVEGFMSWMFKGLAFLLPFLSFAYFFQLYNAIKLYHLYQDPRCTEWQVPVLSIIHLVLFLGNMTTTLKVLKQKFTEDMRNKKKFYKNKYRFNNKQKVL
ncbi:ion channel TACAN-like [Ruditapes philippinarum]|uniref:ion channel TACAN-like n=1 Tax=Ruditapes philippinarum TaxID=129788 RepID=UPI00295A5B6F|nr:ion channel TACAN-like [Ruditapes philippinarum]